MSNATCSPPLTVGKSAFGSYLLWQAIRSGRTVFYVSSKVTHGYVFHKDGSVAAFATRAFDPASWGILNDPATVLIFDGDGNNPNRGQGQPPLVNATTVLLTSPKVNRYKDFQREGARNLVFPVFSRTEMRDMLESCFARLHSEADRVGVWQRYDKWGGIPRYVLERLEAENQELIDSAITSVHLERMADVLSQADIEDDSAVSHRLFHLAPRGLQRVKVRSSDGSEQEVTEFLRPHEASSYFIGHTDLGSPHIAGMVLHAMRQKASRALLSLLSTASEGTYLCMV